MLNSNSIKITKTISKKNKSGGLFQIGLIVAGAVVFIIFIIAMINLTNEKNNSQDKKQIKSFSEFLKDVFEKVNVSGAAKATKEDLKYFKVNMCDLRDVVCLPTYTGDGRIIITATNMIPKAFYDLKNATITIQSPSCNATLLGPTYLVSGRPENFTADCVVKKYLLGNITIKAYSKDNVPYVEHGEFFVKE